MTFSPSPRHPGFILSERYEVERKLGSGSLGRVYLARDLMRNRTVALKVVRSERFGPGALTALQREFRAIASLRHPQIAQAFDFGYSTDEARLPFYTMEYVEGEPLASGPPSSGSRPLAFLQPVLDVLEALEYLHAHGLLHLDVHPGNVIVSPRDRGAVLIDIGMVRPNVDAIPSVLMKSATWIAPEVVAGQPPTPSADLFSVGKLARYRLTSPHDRRPHLPREIPGWGSRRMLALERVLDKATDDDPEQRFESAAAFRDALVAALGTGHHGRRVFEPGDVTMGRARELGAIDATIDSCLSGKTSVLWFVGDFGIGKSQLLEQARVRAQLRGLEVVQTRFAPQETQGVLRDRLSRSVPKAAEWLAPLAMEHGGSSAERASKVAQSFLASHGAAVVLLLDDVELADRESRLLVDAFLEECLARSSSNRLGRGLALVLASQAPPPKPAGGDRKHVKRLRPLSTKTSQDLLESLLRPLNVPRALIAEWARASQGKPRRLRMIARAVQHGRAGRGSRDMAADAFAAWSGQEMDVEQILSDLEPTDVGVLLTLAVCARGLTEVQAAAICSSESVARARRSLRRLTSAELVIKTKRGRSNLYYIPASQLREQLSATTRAVERKRIHERAAAFLQSQSSVDLHDQQSLVHHLFACGKATEGHSHAMATSQSLRTEGHHEEAVNLLEHSLRHARSRLQRLHLAEAISEIRSATGDHAEGISVLEPVFVESKARLNRSEAVRLRRRLGVHFHRLGDWSRAVTLFDEALGFASAAADATEIIFIYSELAEIHTFRGDFEAAKESCNAGLELLSDLEAKTDFKRSMEVTLRASLGHAALRSMQLERAIAEFEEALKLARTTGTTTFRAQILNNLGIAHNQRSDFSQAERCFRRAAKLHLQAGDRANLIQTACNLAVIAAKRGSASAARAEIKNAQRRLQEHPGVRLEFFVGVSAALTEHLVGESEKAVESFRAALPLGYKLEDHYLVHFSEVYLAEAEIACGRYDRAGRVLRSALKWATRSGPPVLKRMAASRALALDRMLGREQKTSQARRVLDETPRTEIELLEAWTDLFVAAASGVAPLPDAASTGASPAAPSTSVHVQRAHAVFRRLGVSAGARMALVALLYDAIANKATGRVRTLLTQLEADADASHAFLRVLEPLARGEACLFLGEMERAQACLRQAAAAMVGKPFLELDWRIEYTRARVAQRLGDREDARHYLHRSLQARELVARSVTASRREQFLAQPRFRDLDALRSRLERPRPHETTPLADAAHNYHGFIGASAVCQGLFDRLARLRDLDLPALIVGATGTGKELVARIIHANGPHRRGPFHVLQATALPAELFESELFGYEAGAFTGAEDSRVGLLEHLSGGTLLIDEVDQLTASTQKKLLQVVDSKLVRPLGSINPRPIDVRFLASSSVDPAAAVASGQLLPELLYRLAQFEIQLPPLKERPDDVPLLMRHFLSTHGEKLGREPPSLSTGALDLLSQLEWPGNVRELQTVAVRLLVSHAGSTVDAATVEDLLAPDPRREEALFSGDLFRRHDLKSLRNELERAYLIHVFETTGGDVQRMLTELNVGRSNLYSWFKRVGLDVQNLRRRVKE